MACKTQVLYQCKFLSVYLQHSGGGFKAGKFPGMPLLMVMQIERKFIDGCRDAILPRLDYFCGVYGAVYGASRALPWPTWSPAFRFASVRTQRQQNDPTQT